MSYSAEQRTIDYVAAMGLDTNDAVWEYAKRNYERGWDVVIETMTSDEVAAAVSSCKNFKAAISKLWKEVVKPWRDDNNNVNDAPVYGVSKKKASKKEAALPLPVAPEVVPHIQILPEIISAIYSVWREICWDVSVDDNEEALELVIDANRLSFHGYQKEEEALNTLILSKGLPPVAAAIAARVKLV